MDKKYFFAGAVSTFACFLIGGIPVGIAAGVIFSLSPLLLNRPQRLELQRGQEIPLLLQETDGIRILTFNILMRPSLWFVRNMEDDLKNERLDSFVQDYLPRYSIVCLQEMFGTLNFRQRRLLKEAGSCGFLYAAVGGGPPLGVCDWNLQMKIPFLDSGLVTLSKFPILETEAHHYTRAALIDSWAPKMVLWSLIRLPNSHQYLHVFNTHLQSTHTGWSAEETLRARAHQTEELVYFVRRKLHEHPPSARALICGDFNMDARRHVLDYERLVNLLQRELELAERGWCVKNVVEGEFPVTYGLIGERTLTMEKDWDSAQCLDYMLFIGPRETMEISGGLARLEREGGGALSDHQGLEGRILNV